MNKLKNFLIINRKFVNNIISDSLNRNNSSSSSFKSDLSLGTLYPNSNLEIRTITEYKIAGDSQQKDKFSGYIPIDKLKITYSRSSGPGGQNVNCVNTKVDVRFHVNSSNWIPDNVRKRILDEYKNKINSDGYFIVKSDITRSQQMNLADALEKIRTFIRKLELIEKSEPSQDTLEKLRRRQEKAARERLMIKRNRSQIKADRKSPTDIS